MRLEKSLAEEKSSNAAVKQELQQRAKAEKSLRDKDSNEALQRFNSVQQSLKILQSEHQDLKEDCSKGQKQALHEREGLEETLTELRTQIMRAKDDKAKSLEHLKTRNIELEVKNEKLQKKYDELLKSTENDDSGKQHLQKEVFQLRRELEEAQVRAFVIQKLTIIKNLNNNEIYSCRDRVRVAASRRKWRRVRAPRNSSCQTWTSQSQRAAVATSPRDNNNNNNR